jgi:hypothetical protein
MKNKEYLAKLNDNELAALIAKGVFQQEIHPEDFCKGVCQYADEKGNCTRFDAQGNVDCPWEFEERIVNWLNAERHK